MLFLPPLELPACPACCGVLPSASFAPAGAVTFEPMPRFRPDARAFFLLCQDTYRPHGGHDLPVWVGRALMGRRQPETYESDLWLRLQPL